MTETDAIRTEIRQTLDLLRTKLGVRGTSAERALSRSKRLLPSWAQGALAELARAEQVLDHPRLSLTLDRAALSRSARELRAHLKTIDVADRRKGWWLGMLGGLSFNLIAFTALLIGVLVWRGFL